METIATSWSTWIVEITSKLKQWQILWGGSVSATMMECFLISLLNYIWNINFFLYSFFLKYCDFVFFCHNHSVKEHVVNSKCILMLLFGICLSFFGVFIRAILEPVCQSFNFYNASPFSFCSVESKSVYLSTYQQSAYQFGWMKLSVQVFWKQFYRPKQYHLSKPFIVKFSSNKGFIRTFLECVGVYCHQKLLS